MEEDAIKPTTWSRSTFAKVIAKIKVAHFHGQQYTLILLLLYLNVVT